jgi:lipopolysaccharide/colanic/teichoic acid biosynthesis glycosyltransferase
LKRIFDLIVGCVALIMLAFPLVAIALVVRYKLGSPIFFIQERSGLNGKPFRMVKFRTMTNKRTPDGNLLPDAERLTPFGRWLRATSLDELPELLNVLNGDMSLVGPRPLLMEYLSLYSPDQSRRHNVPPGLTGWAQVNGRNAISWEEKFNLDVWYVEHRNLWLDIKILFKTIIIVLNKSGINSTDEAAMPRFNGTKDQSN